MVSPPAISVDQRAAGEVHDGTVVAHAGSGRTLQARRAIDGAKQAIECSKRQVTRLAGDLESRPVNAPAACQVSRGLSDNPTLVRCLNFRTPARSARQ
jgi:hypothetical protein